MAGGLAVDGVEAFVYIKHEQMHSNTDVEHAQTMGNSSSISSFAHLPRQKEMISATVEAEKAGLEQGSLILNPYYGLAPKYQTGFLMNRNSWGNGSRKQAPGGWLTTAAVCPLGKGSASR
jgi:hypothetical protein